MKTRFVLTLCIAALALSARLHAQTAAKPPAAPPPSAADRRFTDLKRNIEEVGGRAKAADVEDFIRLGIEAGRPTEASLSIQGYLREASNPGQEAIRLSATVAALAGDYRMATTRYRRYLDNAKGAAPSAGDSQVLADLLRLEIDVLQDHASAYRSFRDHGLRLRQNPRVRKYDEWFLNLALKASAESRESVADAANLLAVVLAEKMPLEQERVSYWRYLEPVFMGAYNWPLKAPTAALPALARSVPLIRDNKALALRYALCVAELQTRAAVGEDAAKAGAAAIAAAKAYVTAVPTADALKTAVNVLARGPSGSNERLAERQAFGAFAFDLLPQAEKDTVLRWDRRALLMAPAQWIDALARQSATLRASPSARALRIGTELVFDSQDKALNTPEVYSKQAAFLQGVESDAAALINSVAAGLSDFGLAIEHFFAQEAWHFTGDPEAAFAAMWSAYSRLPRAEPLSKDLNDRMLLAFAGRLAATPGVRRTGRMDFYREYLLRAWRNGTLDERLAALQKFSWVPAEERQLKDAIGAAQEEFRRSAAYMLKQNPPTITREEVDRISAAFDALLRPADSAPNPLCKAVARAERAVLERKADEYAAAAREAWALAKGYRAARTPFGLAACLWLAEPHQGVDSVDVQCAFLAEAIAGGDAAFADAVFNSVLRGRDRWLWDPEGNEYAAIRKVNAVLHRALLTSLEAGKFDAEMFSRFRRLRSNNRMRDHEFGLDVVEKMIQKRQAGTVTPDMPDTVAIMNLLAYEFAALQPKYPLATAFEALMAKDIAATRKLDFGYYTAQGTDATGAVLNEAAKLLMAFDAAPLGYTDQRVPCEVGALWRWHDRVLGSAKTDPALRGQFAAKLNAAYGKTRFDPYAARNYTLFDPTTADGRAAWFAQVLTPYLDRVATSVWQWPLPLDFSVLSKMGKPADFTPAELATLARVFGESVLRQTDPNLADTRWAGSNGMDVLIRTLHEGLSAKGRHADLLPLAPHFWTWNRDWGTDDSRAYLADCARKMAETGNMNIAVAFAAGGIDVAGGVLKQDVRQIVRQVTNRGTQEFAYIPVPPTDARYPVYKAQVAHKGGDMNQAWEALAQGKNALLTTFKELDPNFVAWAIRACADRQLFDLAEQVGREMGRWFDEGTVTDPEVKAVIGLAQAHVSFVQKNYPTARARLEQILADQAFADTQARLTAELEIADIDRLTKDFDAAVRRIEELRRNASQRVRDDAGILMARINYDRGDFKEAKQLLEGVIQHSPERDDAVLLTGEVDLALRHLMDATDLDRMGEAIARQIIVPGQPLKITLQDEMASVVGHAKSIAVVAWSEKAGDKETFTLMPQGDIRRRFAGIIGTALAPVKQNDGTLQVLGEDIVRYDFDPEFAKQQDVKEHQMEALMVKTDGSLAASSGRILTSAEQKTIALEAEIRATLKLTEARSPNAVDIARSEVRQLDAVKPGNVINLQIEDPDRSTSHAKDTIMIDVVTSSGDAVRGVKMTETDTHSGVFNGSVSTAPAQPRATASDTTEGRDPNATISPKPGCEPWVGAPRAPTPRLFTVDLSDNYALDTLKILADVPGRAIKRLGIQTAFTRQAPFTAVGLWPGKLTAWDGSLQMELVKYTPTATGGKGAGVSAQIAALLADNQLTGSAQIKTVKLPAASVALDQGVGGHAAALGLASADDMYAVRLRGAFYVHTPRAYSFRLVDRNQPDLVVPTVRGEALKYEFNVGATAGETRGAGGTYLVQKALAQGVYMLSVCFTARRDEAIKFEILSDATTTDQSLALCQASLFDPVAQPRIRKEIYREPVAITPAADGKSIDVAFAGARANLVRLVILENEGDAPAIRSLSLKAVDGKTILPTARDYLDLRSNDILEILAGDIITATYKDPCAVNESRRVHTAKMNVTFTDATITPCYVRFEQQGATTLPRYVPMVRFKIDEPVCVVVSDADMDVSEKLDTVNLSVETVGGAKVELQAVEREPHSAVFIGKILPVVKAPAKPGELMVQADDTITITYIDKENLNPGIAWPRTVTVNSSVYVDPQVRVYDCISTAAVAVVASSGDNPKAPARQSPKAAPVATPAKAPAKAGAVAPAVTLAGLDENQPESFRKAFSLVSRRPAKASVNVTRVGPNGALSRLAETGAAHRVHIDGPMLVEVLWPSVVLSPESELSIFAQTSTGRAKYGKPLQGAFDLDVPGTIMLTTRPGAGGSSAVPPQYTLQVIGDPFAISPLVDGRFTFSVPKTLGECPDKSLVQRDAQGKLTADSAKDTLAVKGSDSVYIGFRYTDGSNTETWVTEKVVKTGDAILDVMDRAYRNTLVASHVGEKVYMRLVDKTRDTTDAKDAVPVLLRTSSGHTVTNLLVETQEHTGIFKGVSTPLVDKAVGPGDADYFPCRYGDTVTVAYAYSPAETITQSFAIHRGADGRVQPFTKRFRDPQIAIKTQFAVAEAHFEQAKNHRQLNRQDLAKDEIANGRRVLKEAMRDFPDFDFHDHAEYLLANLAMELAGDEKDQEARNQLYREAVGKFSQIVVQYPESDFAPRAQYKKALCYEKLLYMDQACEEYVKLSYQYPEHELIAETIARLGQYFWRKARALEKDSKPLRESAVNNDRIQGEKLLRDAQQIYRTAAEVFSRLGARFPEHNLAGKTMMLAAQAWMQAAQFERSLTLFGEVVDKYGDNVEIAPEAMYWQGEANFRSLALPEAYKAWTKLTWDYPKTEWARYARARLSEPAMVSAARALQ